jgi:hypothetical protein
MYSDNSSESKPFNWRDHLDVHPAAELFPPMSTAELEALARDIKVNGLETKVTIWSETIGSRTMLLDGRSRLDALALLGWLCVDDKRNPCTTKCWDNANRKWIENNDLCPCRITEYTVDSDPYAYVVSANIHRRHLTAEQKRDLIAALLKTRPEQSNRSIAKQTKTDHKTVASVRTESEGRGEIPHIETRLDSKGRQQPAKKQKATVAKGKQVDAGVAPQKPEKTKRPGVSSRDAALERFDAYVLELIQRTKGANPQRFCKTAVPNGDMRRLAVFLNEIIAVKKLATADDPATSAEAMVAKGDRP